MTFKSNVQELKTMKTRASTENKNKIQTIIELYENKTNPNFKTALNAVSALASTHKSVLKSGNGETLYNTIINKYQEAEPIKGKLERERQKKKQDDKKDELFIDLILYVPKSETIANKKRKIFKGLHQVFTGTIELKITDINENTYNVIKSENPSIESFLKNNSKKLITINQTALGRQPTETESRLFLDLVNVLRGNDKIDMMFSNWGDSYVQGIYMKSVIKNEIKPRRTNLINQVRARD